MFKKVVEENEKEKLKKAAKPEKVVKKETKPVKEVEEVKPPAPVILPDLSKAEKKELYRGVGLVGSHPIANRFRGLIKIHDLIIGEEIIKMLKKFNEEHPENWEKPKTT